MRFEPLENSIFSTDLYGKQTCRIFCVSYLFECNENLLLNSYFHEISVQGKPVAISNFLLIYTGCKPVANIMYSADLHVSQTCCKFYICIGFTREANLLQILCLH